MLEMSNSVDLEDLAPTARLVYLVLEDADRPLTKPEIADRAYSRTRSVTRGLDELRDVDLVEWEPSVDDSRFRRYSLRKR